LFSRHTHQKIENWRQENNHFRPHSSLNNLTPEELINQEKNKYLSENRKSESPGKACFSKLACPKNGGPQVEN